MFLQFGFGKWTLNYNISYSVIKSQGSNGPKAKTRNISTLTSKRKPRQKQTYLVFKFSNLKPIIYIRNNKRF
jgi:hypothetical protein